MSNFIKVPANTIIRVRTTEGVASDTARVGDVVPMEVLSDVLINGRVVVRQGAPAVGEISMVKEARSMGRRGHVALTLNYVEALTGEHLLVAGNRYEKGNGKAAKLTAEITLTTAATGGLIGALWLFEKGHDTSIPPGTASSVYTVGDTTLDLSLLAPPARTASTGAIDPAQNSSSPALPLAMSSAPMSFPALGVLVRTKLNMGAEIVGVTADSPAEKAGMKIGYILCSVDDSQIKDLRDFAAAMQNRAPGSSARLSWYVKTNLGWMPTWGAPVVLR